MRMPRAAAVRWTEVPLKLADSKTTIGGVAHDLAVGAAHDAGHAHGLVLVADAAAWRAVSFRSLPSRVWMVSPSRAVRTMILPPSTQREVEGVHGLAVFQHHIVGDVHDVVDGAHARSSAAAPASTRGRAGSSRSSPSGRCTGGTGRASSMSTSSSSAMDAAAALHLRGVQLQGTGRRWRLASRARPMTDRQSGRLGVISNSTT